MREIECPYCEGLGYDPDTDAQAEDNMDDLIEEHPCPDCDGEGLIEVDDEELQHQEDQDD